MSQHTLEEQETVHDSIQADDGASSVDAGASAASAPAIREAASEPEEDNDKIVNHPGALIAEAKRYRKRAQAAERSLEETRAQLSAREAAINEHQQTIAALQRRQAIDEALHQAGAIDFEVARALVENAFSQNAASNAAPDAEASNTASDAAAAVLELQRSKPYLFRQARRTMSAGVQCARRDENENTRERRLVRAAEDAQTSGKRIDVLRYLRLRRRS